MIIVYSKLEKRNGFKPTHKDFWGTFIFSTSYSKKRTPFLRAGWLSVVSGGREKNKGPSLDYRSRFLLTFTDKMRCLTNPALRGD